MSKDKKVMDLQKLVEHPSSLKLLILHTPFPLEISSLWKCSNLIKLDLSKNNLESFPYIGNLANLKFMFLHQNKLDHHILRNIFFSQKEYEYSALSRSIVWVTFWGNRNCFLARHFLCNQTSVLAVDNHLVVQQERKHSVLIQQTPPFSPQTDISYILSGRQSLGKNATEQQYMEQFWHQMRDLRTKILQLNPIIKIQKVFRGFILRKKLSTRQEQVVVTNQILKKVFQEWKKTIKRKNKLFQLLKQKKKQHYLLPLKQMRLQQIKIKMLQWAARAKKRALSRKLSLNSQVKFYNTLRNNFLMFKSLYEHLQIQKSSYLLIDASSLKAIHSTVKNFVSLFNNQDTFSIGQNKDFIIRQSYEGSLKRQFARLLSLNSSSYIIKINKKLQIKTPLQKSLLNQNICRIHPYSTSLKPLFKNENKLHFSVKQQERMKKCTLQLEKRQKLTLQQYVIIKGSLRVLKDVLRSIFYINTKALTIDGLRQQISIDKIKLYSQKSLQKLSSITLIQKFWRGYSFRKKQKLNAQNCAKQYRAVVKIQRWIRKLPLLKKFSFMKQTIPILKSITKPCFYIKMHEYLQLINNSQEERSNYLTKMKFLQQNLVPYFNLMTKKIILHWNTNQLGPQNFKSKINVCSQMKKKPFTQYLTQYITKSYDQKRTISDVFVLEEKDIQECQKGEVSHLFHFNTLISLAQKDNQSYIKVYCNSLQETKLRVLGILLKSYSFTRGSSIKIFCDEPIDFQKYQKSKIINEESVFIARGDIDLKEQGQQIKKYNFRSKFYLKDENDQRPIKVEENLFIFTHNFKGKSQQNNDIDCKGPKSEFKIQIQKPKRRTRLSVEQLYFSESIEDKSIKNELKPKISTICHDQAGAQSQITKIDLLPTALKRILPLKKEIKSYKIQKRIKKRQPSFVLDSSSKQQRVLTLPDLPMQQPSAVTKEEESQFQYSTVKQKIKKNYLYRKDLIKSQKEEHSFHQNFMNLNNFLQQQNVSEHRRRIKTQIQISAYVSADKIRAFHQKSSDQLLKKKQDKLKRVEQDIKNHKQSLEKHRMLRNQQKQEFQRVKSMQRQKSKQEKKEVKRLKVSFAQQCFPIISRSYNELRNSSRSLKKSTENKFKIS